MAIVTLLVIETDMAIVTALVIETDMAIVIALVIKTHIHLSEIEPGIKCKELVSG